MCVCVNSWIPVGQQSSQELSPHRHKHLPETDAHSAESVSEALWGLWTVCVCVWGGQYATSALS